MSFFIRGKKDSSLKRKLNLSKGSKINKKFKKFKNVQQGKKLKGNTKVGDEFFKNEEISSSDDEELFEENENRKRKDHLSDTDEDDNDDGDLETLTVQEKKLKLAKKYLEEIEREECERLETSKVSDDILVERLKEEGLSKAGKLRRKLSDKFNEITENNIYVLRNKDHNLAVTCIVISSDIKFIYSGSKDGSIIKWCLESRKKVKSILNLFKSRDKSKPCHDGTVLSIAISNDNQFLVTGDMKNVIHVWNPDTMEHIHTFKGHTGPISGLSICPETNHLYSSSYDRSVRIWSLGEKMYIETLFGHQANVTSVDVICKDRAISSGGIDNSVRVWKISEESQLIFNGSGRTIDTVRKLDDTHFISCGDDGMVCVWGILKKKPFIVIKNAHGLDEVTKEPHWITGLASISFSDIFATGSCDGNIKLWKHEDNYKNASILFNVPVIGFINSMVFSQDHRYLAVAVGQEHKLGRWSKIKEAKNSVVLIELTKKNDVISKN